MTAEERLQQHLLMMLGEPVLPLHGMQSIKQALRLRSAGMTYTAVSTAMSIYHGDIRTENAWRSICRHHGAAPRHHPNAPRLAPQQREGS